MPQTPEMRETLDSETREMCTRNFQSVHDARRPRCVRARAYEFGRRNVRACALAPATLAHRERAADLRQDEVVRGGSGGGTSDAGGMIAANIRRVQTMNLPQQIPKPNRSRVNIRCGRGGAKAWQCHRLQESDCHPEGRSVRRYHDRTVGERDGTQDFQSDVSRPAPAGHC